MPKVYSKEMKMNMKWLWLYLALMILPAVAPAGSIDGFDEFAWGTIKNEIVEFRGEGHITWGNFEVWQAKAGESVSGFPIKLLGYEFNDGCSAVQSSKAIPCLLKGGAYILETTSTDDIAALIDLLGHKYGQDKVSYGQEEKRRSGDGFLYAKINSTRHNWKQTDESAIELFYKSYDRDFVENLNQVKKGIFRVGVRYYSPGHAKQSQKGDDRDKTF